MTETPSLPLVNDQVLEQLNALMFAFRGEMHRAMREAGLPINPMELRVLMHIARHPGCTAGDLARHSGRDKAQIARLLQQLEQAGLALRQAHAEDRRVQRLFLTEEGARLDGQLRRERDAIVRRMLGALSAEEQAQLGGLLARLRLD